MRNRILMATLLAAGAATGAVAAGPADPDWPCVQRKVPHISVGQMWAGPAITDADMNGWRDDDAVAALAPVLAARRTSDEEAGALVAQFASEAGGDRNGRLRLLFAGVFSLIEQERSTVMSGIGRYAHKQTALSTEIEESQNRLSELKAAKEPDIDRIEELEDQVLWETRIFKDRAQSLTYVCETPVILEQRAFSMARMIQAQLE